MKFDRTDDVGNVSVMKISFWFPVTPFVSAARNAQSDARFWVVIMIRPLDSQLSEE